MKRNIRHYIWLSLLLSLAYACQKQPVPLNTEQFRSLLIDLHKVDGTLAVNRGMRGNQELKNYAYYNDLFQKYGISREDFDSCMYYYSAQTRLFSEIYDFIIDSLNKELTLTDKVLKGLKANDSVNYFPRISPLDSLSSDTLRLDSVVTVTIDSIVPGLYKFSTTLQFDSVSSNRTRYIISYFLSEDERDTLWVRHISVGLDTLKRNYNWSQYADSLCSRLVIRYMDVLPRHESQNRSRNKTAHPVKKEKPVDLKAFNGKAWNNQLFRPYISREMENRMKQSIRRK